MTHPVNSCLRSTHIFPSGGGVSGRSRHTADSAGEEVGVLKYIGLGYDFSLATITPATLLNRPSGPPVSTLADLLGCAKVNSRNF